MGVWRRYGPIERGGIAILIALGVNRPPSVKRIDWFTILSATLGLCALASLLLTPRALVSCTWLAMWIAALASFVVSIIGMFSIGAFVFVLTCMQLGAVVAVRCGASRPAWLAGMLGAAVWVAVVPVQLLWLRWLTDSACIRSSGCQRWS